MKESIKRLREEMKRLGFRYTTITTHSGPKRCYVKKMMDGILVLHPNSGISEELDTTMIVFNKEGERELFCFTSMESFLISERLHQRRREDYESPIS